MRGRLVVAILALCACRPRDGQPPADRDTSVVWQTPLPPGIDSTWKYAERASADFDGDGQTESAVLICDVHLDARGAPLWEDGHRWRLYFEEADGTRTYAFERFVPNGRIEAAISGPRNPGEPPVVVLLQRSPTRIASVEVTYGGPTRVRASESYARDLERHFERSVSH